MSPRTAGQVRLRPSLATVLVTLVAAALFLAIFVRTRRSGVDSPPPKVRAAEPIPTKRSAADEPLSNSDGLVGATDQADGRDASPPEPASPPSTDRKPWDGIDSGRPIIDLGINTYVLWSMCRNGVIKDIDLVVNGARAMSHSESRDKILTLYDGVQDHWWFQACVTVSPLIVVDPAESMSVPVDPGPAE